jgi:hypothetical protein
MPTSSSQLPTTTRQVPGRTPLAVVAVLAVLGLVLSAVACSGSDVADPPATDPGFQRTSAPTLKPGQPVPAPTDEVILSISGAISTANVDGRLDLDMATLESVGTVTYSVDDQQAEGRVVRFEGVLLSDVLAVAGVSADATTLVTTALNDYSIDIPLSDASESPVMIATRVDGDRMPVDRFGPTRVVYPYSSHDLDPVVYDPRWIWQLASIVVR